MVGPSDAPTVPPVWVLSAPSGYGKTTLARQIAQRLARPTVWLTVDDRDDDAHRFWSHVAAGLGEHGVDTSDVDEALAADDAGASVDAVLAAIERHGEALTIVLDDVHELESPEVLDGIGRLLDAHPGDATIGVLTRRELDRSALRLRMHGLLTELSSEDLAYSPDEALDALRDDIAEGRLDAETADAIIARLDGWPAGLRLAQLAIRGDDDSAAVLATIGGAHPDLAGYLAGEVLDGLADDVREFIVATSVLDDLTPGACDAVTGTATGLSTLRSLTADHVFTTLVDPITSTFRYHGIFRDFARSRLAESSHDHRVELHRRALQWFEHTDDTDAVIRHAVAAEQIGVALDRMLQAYIPMANGGQIDTLWRWVKTIGAESVLAHPVLGPLPAWASLNRQRYDEIEPWLESIDLVDGLSEEHRTSFETQAASIRCNRERHLGHLDEAVRHGLAAVRATHDRRDALAVGTAQASLGVALALAGDESAQTTLLRAIESAESFGEAASVVMSYAHLGLTTDDDEQARAWSDRALDLVDSPSLERFHRPAAAWLTRAGVQRRSGRVRDAGRSVVQGLELAVAAREPATEALLHAERARIAHLLGEDVERRAALRDSDRAVEGLSGAGHVSKLVRGAHNETRFAPNLDDDALPVGARELTERELVVVKMLEFGLPRRELAEQLFVSENTVKTHLTAIRRKLGATGREDLVERARALGILTGGG